MRVPITSHYFLDGQQVLVRITNGLKQLHVKKIYKYFACACFLWQKLGYFYTLFLSTHGMAISSDPADPFCPSIFSGCQPGSKEANFLPRALAWLVVVVALVRICFSI